MNRAAQRYAPFYCEENVWQLARSGQVAPASVVFVSNRTRSCALWAQRAASELSMPVLWDYHVILVAHAKEGPLVYDLDSRLEFPLTLPEYLRGTFPSGDKLRKTLRPRFRVVDVPEFLEHFGSDRSHMQEDGEWRAPPPDWTRIGEVMNLFDFVETERDFYGQVGDLTWLIERDW